jgi:small-conductance mechanosensitive channel
MQVRYISVLGLLLLSVGHVLPMIPFDRSPTVALALLSNTELYQKRRIDLDQAQAEFKKRAEEGQKGIARLLSKVTADLAEVQNKLKGASEREADYLNKKTTLLHDRRQNLGEMQELWEDSSKLLEDRGKVINEILVFLSASRQGLKVAYAWKEFRDIQLKVAEYTAKIRQDKAAQENTVRQLSAAQERLVSLEKQYEAKEHLAENVEVKTGDKAVPTDVAALRYEAELLDQQINELLEKISAIKLLNEKLIIEQKLLTDVVAFDQFKLDEQRTILHQVEQRLIIDHKDVEIAKTIWTNELQTAFVMAEQLNKTVDEKKVVRDKLVLDIEAVKEKIEKNKAAGLSKKPEFSFLKTQHTYLLASLRSIDQELAVLNAKKLLADTHAKDKELQFNMVDMRYRLKTEVENFDEFLIAFRSRKDEAVRNLKELEEKQKSIIALLIDTNRDLEKLKIYEGKIVNHRITRFKGKDRLYNDCLSNLDNARKQMQLQLRLAQAHLAVLADLITQQEKIVSQCQLMVHELEARHRTHSIWKRSSHAISSNVLVRSVVEVESFFKKLYWETPANLKPSALWQGARSLSWYDLLLLLACCVFYAVAFFVVRSVITVLRRRLSATVEQYQGRTRYIYMHLFIAVADFLLEYLALWFTWLFLFLHVYFDFDFVFQALAPFDTPYLNALFYVTSIPLLVYLSSRFIERLEMLNTQLSYKFVAEALQWRFMWLVTVFCYTTAVLIPLRAAIVHYADFQYAESAAVLSGAYSLMLLIVILLFFNKDDILYLLPSRTNFMTWFKRKVDKYYYPVFLCVMGTLVLANPYVGYANMAWFLAFAIPSSIALIYVLLSLHFYLRKYAVFIFMKEDEDEFIDKFEHAKAFYGFFVIFSFVALFFIAFFLVMRIWGIYYSITDMWKALADQWVIYVDAENKVGLIEFMMLGLFVMCGFVISSIIEKFVLNKLFDILRSEPGTQNTISRIAHYTIVFMATVFGLYAIHLGQFILVLWASFAIGLGWAMKDIVSDWVAGFFVLIERPIEIGNYVQIDTIEGTVHKIAARSTTIVTSRNHSIIIPNKDLVAKSIINWGHGRFAVGFEMNIRVEQASNPDEVKQLLISIVQANPLVLKVPAIVARLEDIEDSAFCYLVRAFISARRVKEQWEIAAALRADIVKAFKEHHIELAKPARKLYLGDDERRGVDSKPIEIKFNQ